MNQPTQENLDILDQVRRELKLQVEVNRRLARELIDVRLELAQLKLRIPEH